MKALVTGAAGYIGRILCKILKQEGWEVVANDILYHSSWDETTVDWICRSYSNKTIYDSDHKYDVIFHLGANSLLGPSVEHPLDYFQNNVSEMIEMLQFVGTDLIRKYVDHDFWCRAYEKEIKQYDKVVSPDVRFDNERRTIRKLGGKMVLVKRPGTRKSDSHASENDYGFDIDYSYVLLNDGSIEDLHNSVNEWYTNIKPLLILGL